VHPAVLVLPALVCFAASEIYATSALTGHPPDHGSGRSVAGARRRRGDPLPELLDQSAKEVAGI
jgi:hypothetical protein